MIQLKNIYKTYKMGEIEVKALDGVSLNVGAGEFIAIMGPSGSGKSTLMHIMGLLDRPDSGLYILENRDLTVLSDEQLAVIRNRLVGFVFQQFHLLARMSALENARLPLVYAGKQHLKDKARQNIELVGLGDRMFHRPNELSGGQQQRVAIARALVTDPLIILADEPTGNLDTKSKTEIISMLQKLNQQGKTVILVTHEPEIAAYARRVITMRDGKIVSDKLSGAVPADHQAIDAQQLENVIGTHYSVAGRAKFFDYFKQAAFAMFSHKMRSILSILGILIGVAAVIAMLALGEGAKLSIQKQLASLGSNLLVLRPGSARLHGVAMEAGSFTRFTLQDVEAISKLDPQVKRVSAQVSGKGQVVYANKNWSTQVDGVNVEYAPMRASVPEYGRFFTQDELKRRDKLAVIGMTVLRQLFGDANPIGETIKINLSNFKVIGILPEKGAGGFRDQDDVILIPVTTAMYRIFGKEYIDTIFVEASSAQDIDGLQEQIKDIIIKQHRLRNDAQDSFEIRNMADIKNAMETTTKTMSMLLGSIAAISLVVGGIGIMNIMLVSVTERTREIGLRKAIGANNHDIMVQFLIEAVLLSCIGGAGGIVLGSAVSVLITVFAKWTVSVSWASVAGKTSVSA